jgi:V/A-type H+/Na+-transporting ATPase subunit I
VALRPKPTHWFEAYVPRHETVRALGVLAQTGKVELDVDPKVNVSLEVGQIRDALREYAGFESRYREYWPKGEYCPVELPLSPQDTAKQMLERLHWWGQEADPLIRRIEQLRQEEHNLEHLMVLFTLPDETHLEFARLAAPMQLMYLGLGECPLGEDVSKLPDGALVKNVATPDRRFVVVAGLPEHTRDIEAAMASHGCEPLSIPSWLTDDRADNLRRAHARIGTIHHEREGIVRKLDVLSRRHGLDETLGNIGVLKWYVEHAPEVEPGTKFCHVTGWTSEPDETGLNAALRQANVHAMIRFPQREPLATDPTGFMNPWWVQPFEFFTQMFGTPGKAEIDPSGLLFLIVPLLFGYMFPDVGHGLVLIVAGAAFARRWPPITFLIPCGVAAIAFGFVFGEFFSFDGIVPALWMKPLDKPLDVMIVPLVGGVALMLLGILLASIEAYWRGELAQWLAIEAAVVLMYAAALAAPFHPAALPGLALGIAWYFLGGLLVDHARPWNRLLALAGRLLESVFQLLVNTISFARVGAFALGHVALSSALIALAAQTDNRAGYWILIVAGNLFIVAVEGLVVFVQTTRLVLFEFFIRFLRAEGRIFKPLHRPTSA